MSDLINKEIELRNALDAAISQAKKDSIEHKISDLQDEISELEDEVEYLTNEIPAKVYEIKQDILDIKQDISEKQDLIRNLRTQQYKESNEK